MVNDIKETAKKRMDGVIDQLNTNLHRCAPVALTQRSSIA